MWPLLACSIVSLAVSLERLFFWWREATRRDDGLLDEVFRLTALGDCDGAAALRPRRGGDTRVEVLLAGLEHREHGLSEAMAVEASRRIELMKQGLMVLDTIVTMAPLLGILGTVLGIIQSFDMLGDVGIEDPKAVTKGIAQALVTTAAGLAVALATLVPFNYFGARTGRAARDLEQVATQFEVAYRRGKQ